MVLTLAILIGAVLAALASPLPAVFAHGHVVKHRNPLRGAWETAMMYFGSFGMTLLCGMVFLIAFAKLYMLWPIAELVIPGLVAIIGLIDLLADARNGFGFALFPVRRERMKWYALTAQEHHPVILASLASAGELFTSGTPLLLLAADLARVPDAGTVFDQFRPLLHYALAFTIATAALSFGKDRELTGTYRKWNGLLSIAIAAAAVGMLLARMW